MNSLILLIGGNEGNRIENMHDAKVLIQERIGEIEISSSYYESEPWGFEHQQNFINQIIEVSTDLLPFEILKIGQCIEKELGRKPKTKIGYEGRTMDIDILFYNRATVTMPDLIIPHPKLHERKFTLLPLNEMWKNYIHPVFKKSVTILLDECDDNGWVKKLD